MSKEKSKAKGNDFAAWLNQPAERKQSLSCQTCALGQEVRELIQQFMIARASGKSNRANRELFEYLVDNYGYHLSDSAMNTHMRRCEGDLWKKMRATDLKVGMVRKASRLDSEIAAAEKEPPQKRTTKRRVEGT